MEIRRKLQPMFTRLKISKPQLIIWYLMSQGVAMVDELMQLTEEERGRRVLELTHNLNAEFGRHNPIQ